MPSINSINFCPNCGAKPMPNANFCMECGYELKLLEEIIAKHDAMNDSFENVTETVDTSINEEYDSDIMDFEPASDNHASKESFNNQPDSNEVKDDFEIVRPDMEDITENNKSEYKGNKESVKAEDTNNDNNFNLVRPNSQNVTIKKPKVKKNFSILNQKKF